ncbi:unnamed protein product, partial [Sphacelaria rigidula]
LLQELQANRGLLYAVGGGLRTTLAHELSLKAPEHPELAHHLGRSGTHVGSNNPDELDDEMAGAIDLNDVDWASSDVDGGINDGGSEAEANAVASAAAELMNPTSLDAVAASVSSGGAEGSAGSVAGNGQVSVSAVETGLPPGYGQPGGRMTRGSRAQRTCPFPLKACSACKKGKATALQCRLDSSPTSAAQARLAAAAGSAAVGAAAAKAKAAAAAAAAAAKKGPAGPRAPRPESASSLLDRMLGRDALPAPAPAARPAPVVVAPPVAPGAPTPGGMGIKRPRCLAKGCTNAVSNEVAFCSVDCTVAAQKQACQALLVFHRNLHSSSMVASTTGSRGVVPASNGNAAVAAVGAPGGSGGGTAGAAGGSSGEQQPSAGGGGGAAAAAAAAPASAAAAVWTAQDEEEFSKGLEAVRTRNVLTPAMRFRQKVRDRFRELFSEGMVTLGGAAAAEVAVMAGVLAWDLEHELNVFSRSDRGKYKEKAQSLRFNIKFAKNPELFKDLLTGGTSMKSLLEMSTDDLASSHLKEERKRIRVESYAGHLRQEDEGNEIVYKDGALQKIAKVCYLLFIWR